MDRAKDVLRNSSEPIAEVGLKFGYQSAAGFSRAFHKLFLMSPRDWRRSIGGRELREGNLEHN